MAVEGRAEAVDEGDGAEPRARSSRRVVVTCRARRRDQQSLYSSEKNPRERGDSLGSVGEEAAQSPAKSASAWARRSPTGARAPVG